MSRPAALIYTEVATGDVLDQVSLAGEGLVFTTGAARDVFASQQDRFGWSDARAYDHFTGWSNGYVVLQPR